MTASYLLACFTRFNAHDTYVNASVGEILSAQVSDVEKKLIIMCLQIAKGMEYLAEQKFVHRDLEPETACEFQSLICQC